jgi:hypothetical protein
MGMNLTTNRPTCAVCQLGKYKEGPGNVACTLCHLNAQSTTTSTQTGSISSMTCRCYVGYTGLDCLACPAGTYKGVNGNFPCIQCPDGSYSTSASMVCSCNTRYTRTMMQHGDGACTVCATGTYKPAVCSATCVDCPGNSTSLPFSANMTACVCNTSFCGPPGGPCALCAAGTYEPGRACLPCPANISHIGSTPHLCRSPCRGP